MALKNVKYGKSQIFFSYKHRFIPVVVSVNLDKRRNITDLVFKLT